MLRNLSKLLTLCALSLVTSLSMAKEGMWVPSTIQKLVADDMTAMGMKISPEELYAVNKSSIKDAIVHFGGGCTSVLVSDGGLLLTNHHCGYSRIQAHSSLDHNYLEDGFWAMSKEEELSNPNLTATIIQEMVDVTDKVLEGLDENASQSARSEHIKAKIEELVKEVTADSLLNAYVRAFYYGNQYLLFKTKVYKDVRLVGAPPSSIGKYGYDTDNWVWPRHTGDFSVFRVYANKDNDPAAYNTENVPYKPDHFLPVNVSGVEKDDFTLVYGFPGRTENYIASTSVEQVLDVLNPLRYEMRSASLDIIDAAMRKDPLTKIQYSAKQSRISNAHKKWIGQTKGLKRHKAIAKKDSLESLFKKRMTANPEWSKKYDGVLEAMAEIDGNITPLNIGRNYFIEFFYMGPEILRFIGNFKELVVMSKDESVSDEAIRDWITERKQKLGFYKNYNADIDRDIMIAQLPMARQAIKKHLSVDIAPLMEGDVAEYVSRAYGESVFTNKERMMEFLENYNRKRYKKIGKDKLWQLSVAMEGMYFSRVKEPITVMRSQNDSLMRIWMEAQMEVLPERVYSPDANGTLRITFGKVEGYVPFDGAEYDYYTTLEGVIEKEDPTNPEFNLPSKLKELYADKDYGQYADEDGKIRVCFVASNHTSGGNSGSPVLDGNGHLIGLNFDRTWESTMSDIMFNPTICRNITVDIRYVLFIMDKYAGAKHLVDEMKLVKKIEEAAPVEATSPEEG
ncbi:MAG: S46 family peptidase [Flavobacteriales bacterium]|jgi:hypothetical protein|nr:S46 family peptidase [Flavobacteriales bacterium]MBT3964672.1 S46 family peptidase [Flavobacteriales bacterium]MBT4704003.1 S46 family peptidase [Flavobacteriales bacterium]MBT4930301.1 S46 family peptidase [Flavobacteriales bacterium]MBT5132524.1 S46 family peptidase [Flavobacteriales bacterium]